MNIKQILNEATDFTSGINVIKSIKEGNTGISPKFFIGMNRTDESNAILKLNSIINACKETNIDRTKAIKLILKKAKTFDNFIANYNSFDPYITYFKNKDKKESKTIHKDLFDNFVNGKLEDDNEFEKKVNGIFANKTNIKDSSKEVNFIYPKDENGWEMLIPKTFAAAVKYSTTEEGKTHWCTAASKHHFDYYNEKAPLYIIRNYNKNIAYQLFFLEIGPKKNELEIQFMDKNDITPTVKDLKYLVKIIPEKLLEKIKIRSKSFLDLKNKINKEEKDIPKKYIKSGFKPFKTETINEWKKESYYIDDEQALKKFSYLPEIYSKNTKELLEKFFNNENVNVSIEKKIGQADIYTKGNKSYIFVFSKRNGSYAIFYQTLNKGESLNTFRRILISEVPIDLRKIVEKRNHTSNGIIKKDNDFTIKKINYTSSLGRSYSAQYSILYTEPIKVDNYTIDRIDLSIKDKDPTYRIPKRKYFLTFFDGGRDLDAVSVTEDDLDSLIRLDIKDPAFYKSMIFLFPNLKSKLVKNVLDIHKDIKDNEKQGYRIPGLKEKQENIKKVIEKVRGNIK